MVEVKILGGLSVTVRQSGSDFEIVYITGRWIKRHSQAAWLYKRIAADNYAYNAVWRALDDAAGLSAL